MSAPPLLVGVIGAGTMGAGIAQVAATAGHAVVLYDIAEEAVGRGVERVRADLARGVASGKVEARTADDVIARIRPSVDLDGLSDRDLVIEAAPEDLALKRRVVESLDELLQPNAIVASNTSTLSIGAIFGGSRSPERGVGMHFFNPAPRMPLVEVIRGPATSDDVVSTVTELAATWGKVPVVVADTPGFIVNRVARPFYGEALRLLGEGAADVATVDALLRDAGFPMGPFELMDLIGIDVNLAAARSVFDGFFGEPRFRPHPIQQAMVDSGRLGRKSGRGYYNYDESGRA